MLLGIGSCSPSPQLLLASRSPSPQMLLDANVTASAVASVRDSISVSRDMIAAVFQVTPPYVDVAFGCILFVMLNAIAKEATFLLMPTPQLDAMAARLLTVAAFVGFQELSGFPASQWLPGGYGRPDSGRVDPNPFFQSGSPLAGVTFAFAFGIAIAVPAQLAGIEWVPGAREFPEFGGALLLLLVAPLSEEVFFRAVSGE